MDENLPRLIDEARKLGRTPLDLWLRVIMDEAAPLALRLSCARDAAPYVHPKLTHSVVEDRSTDKLTEFLRELKDQRAAVRLTDQSAEMPVVDIVPEAVVVSEDGSI